MVEADVLAGLTQFGTAGLIGWLWLAERRAAAVREREATELVARLRDERSHLDAVMAAVRENTRVLAAMDVGQRRLAHAVERLEAALLYASARRRERAAPSSGQAQAAPAPEHPAQPAQASAKWARGTGADQPVGVAITPPTPDRERDRA